MTPTPDTLRAALERIRDHADDSGADAQAMRNIARAALQGDADAPKKARRIDWSNVVVDEGDEAP